jgi:hypothetical protein
MRSGAPQWPRRYQKRQMPQPHTGPSRSATQKSALGASPFAPQSQRLNLPYENNELRGDLDLIKDPIRGWI